MNDRRLPILEAKLIAATRGREVLAIAEQAPTSKAAIPQVMDAFSVTEEQAAAILDAQFRVATAQGRAQLEEDIRAAKAQTADPGGDFSSDATSAG
jgi:DNA gyrase/topoisomerase IV subunit A